ncbi:VOC family protein [Vibrio caribbeanicus]|uniref:VOC family protein n=1 Tax=Vibrio caribbeanicus TaxID=701175 RepID=UPI0030D9D051
MKIDHVGIQVKSLENSINWYKYVFSGEISWELESFSELTTSRLPNILKLVEIKSDDLKIHLFESKDISDSSNNRSQIQHTAIELDSKEKMKSIIDRVRELNVERSVNSISDIVTDSSNVSSCYFTDPEGNEFELVVYQ